MGQLLGGPGYLLSSVEGGQPLRTAQIPALTVTGHFRDARGTVAR